MKICIVIGEPRQPLGVKRAARTPQRIIDAQLVVEDALLEFGRAAEADLAAEVVAMVIGGRMVRGTPRHALTAGIGEVIHVPVADLADWADADAARLVAAAVGHVGCDVVLVGAEGSGGWDRLAGQVAEAAGMGLCTSMARITSAAGDRLVAEHDFGDERIVLEHDGPLVSTAARSLTWSAPTFAYADVVASRDRVVTLLDVDQLGITRPTGRTRLATRSLEPSAGRRQAVEGDDVTAAATHFLRVIGAVR